MEKQITNTKVLVTGGAGFIGSHLVDSLLAEGNEVVCLDNFATGRRENLVSAMANPRFTLIEGDIRNRDVCKKAVENVKIVFHEAALGSVPRSIADPAESTSVNVAGFVNMLHAAVEAKVDSFVYASSSSVYGDEEKLPKKELKCEVKIRCAARPAQAILTMTDDTTCKIKFTEPQRAAAAGQTAVFYDGDILLGGGTIE